MRVQAALDLSPRAGRGRRVAWWVAAAACLGLLGVARAEEGGERPAEESAHAAPPASSAPAAAGVVPTVWAPSKGNQCHRSKRRRSCEGPRKVPLAQGEALARARRFGLGTPRALLQLQRQVPPAAWVEAAGEGGPSEERLLWPVDGGRFLRGYGLVRRRSRKRGGGAKRLHAGVDIGAAQGTPIRAARSGLVAYSDNGVHGYGNLMMIVHTDATVAWYAHCRAAYVAAGEVVSRAQVIGEVGQTGLARGPHLHFELRREGRPFDPLPLLDRPAPAARGRP